MPQMLRYRKLLCIWLNPTSTAALLGLPTAGGQRHVAFRHAAKEVASFLHGTGITQEDNEWQLPIEPYGDLQAAAIRVYENPRGTQRKGECRLAAQSVESPEHYALWARAVVGIPRGSLPMQAIVFLRDLGDRVHARVIGFQDLSRLSRLAARAVLGFRPGREHLLDRSGAFDDIACPREVAVPRAETGVSGSAMGRGRSRPRPRGAADWGQLRGLLAEAERQPRRRVATSYARILRRQGVRDLVLRCFGERCQARGCQFTETLPQEIRRHVLVVHHLKGLARGGTDRPYNLSVVCANHHALCHYAPRTRLEEIHGADDVLVVFTSGSFLIERDLSALEQGA